MAQDPYRYFRVEAHELIEKLGQGILALDTLPIDAQLVPRLLRYAHTLKGAARVVKRLEMAEGAHRLEELLVPRREAARAVNREELRELLDVVDRLQTALSALDEPKPAPAPRPAAAGDEQLGSVRVNVEEMDAVLRSVTEASIGAAALRRELSAVQRLEGWSSLLHELLQPRGRGSHEEGTEISKSATAKARALAGDLRDEIERLGQQLSAGLGHLESELSDAREATEQLRLVPAKTLFPALQRAVFEAAQSLGKEVAFECSGGDVRLDAHVLSALRDALLHIVRNAVTHGIELPHERARSRKPQRGNIKLEVLRQGTRAEFRCRDDGRGVDVEAARAAAVSRGIVGAAEAAAMSAPEVTRLLLGAGLSTSSRVTELSGRGIGLDVAREAIQRLKGSISLDSVANQGTSCSLIVPVSVASLTALLVEASGSRLAIPLDAVEATLRLAPSAVLRAEHRESVLRDGRAVPFLPLTLALGNTALALGERENWSVVMLTAPEGKAAIGVDRVLGIANVVLRALPSVVVAEPVVAGAALDAEGTPELVLNPSGLVLAAERHRGESAPPPRRTPLPILVIDDSLTTRMLEQSILESAGYRVDLATSAEDGLEKARLTRYGVFIVDVEMPGMSGFDFVATTRADPDLRQTPAILVTSRDAPEDRRRGAQAGASAYVIKGEFEQQHLLRTIRSLLE